MGFKATFKREPCVPSKRMEKEKHGEKQKKKAEPS